MPIPKFTGEVKRDDIVKKYQEPPYNWKKKFQVDWIEINQRTGSIIKKTYEFNADAIPCTNGDCAALQLSFVQLAPSGVMWTCGSCRKTEGPIAFENGRVIKQVTIDPEEAWNVLRKTGQIPPIGLSPVKATDRFRIVS